MTHIWRILAELIVVLHGLLVVLIVCGWLVPELYYWYGAGLIGTASSWLLVQRCVLVDLEYYFRGKTGKYIRPLQSSFLAYWGEYLLGEKAPSDHFITIWGGFFLAGSIALWLLNVPYIQSIVI